MNTKSPSNSVLNVFSQKIIKLFLPPPHFYLKYCGIARYGRRTSPVLFFLLLLAFSVQAQAQSTDTTLSDLTISDGTVFRPAFASATKAYAAGVANNVTRITITPTTNHPSATVSYTFRVGNSGSFTALTDADSNTTGFQADLSVGVNHIHIIVTAEDGSTMETHRLRMYRDSTETCTPTLATGRMFIWTGRLVVGVAATYSDPTTLVNAVYGRFKISGDGPFGAFVETDLTFNIRGQGKFKYEGHALDDYVDNSEAHDGRLLLGLNKELSAANADDLKFHACGDTLAFSDASVSGSSPTGYTWTDTSLNWTTTIAHDLYLSITNAAPEFSSTSETRSFMETEDDTTVMMGEEEDLGAAITATDDDGDTLTYSLEGTGAEKFTIDSSSGQISTKVGESYDRETKASYSLMVRADDGLGGTDTVAVTINVTDVPEMLNLPSLSSDTTNVYVSWNPPSTPPPITSYDIQYREGPAGMWINGPQGVPSTRMDTTIINLMPDTEYHVRVRARNSVGSTGLTQPPQIIRTLADDMPNNLPPSPPPVNTGGRGGENPPPPPGEKPVEPEPEPETMPEPEPEETIAGSRGSGGCSIASSDSDDSAFDLFLMVLTVLIPVWWKIPLSESLRRV